MTTFLFAIVLVGLLMLAMSVGVLAGRKPISGSCGGMKALGMDVECEICGGNPQLCESGSEASGSFEEKQDIGNEVKTFDPGHKS